MDRDQDIHDTIKRTLEITPRFADGDFVSGVCLDNLPDIILNFLKYPDLESYHLERSLVRIDEIDL